MSKQNKRINIGDKISISGAFNNDAEAENFAKAFVDELSKQLGD